MSSAVSNEILSGDGLYLAQAAKLIPPHRLGRPVSPATLTRWIRQGIRLDNGEHVHLEAVCLAGRWMVSRASIRRFLDRQTPPSTVTAPAESRTPTQREQAQQQAASQLHAKYDFGDRVPDNSMSHEQRVT